MDNSQNDMLCFLRPRFLNIKSSGSQLKSVRIAIVYVAERPFLTRKPVLEVSVIRLHDDRAL